MRAFLLSVGVALVCGYLTFCVLFAQGQWQLVLHPVRTTTTVAVPGVTAEAVRFATDATGQPQLTGCWLPADATGQYRGLTVLYLPSGDGSLASATATLTALHELGLGVLAFDYRGYGASAAGHPTQARMEADAESALAYLNTTRHVADARVIVYGTGVGGFLAARLAGRHTGLAAVILDAPRFEIETEVARDPRVRLLPVRLLFHERFDLDAELRTLKTPKLVLSRGTVESPLLRDAADPKITVALPPGGDASASRTITRFLDQYAPDTPPAALVPGTTPQP